MAATDEGMLPPTILGASTVPSSTPLTTGNVPSLPELADRLGSSPEAIQDALRVLAAADYLAPSMTTVR